MKPKVINGNRLDYGFSPRSLVPATSLWDLGALLRNMNWCIMQHTHGIVHHAKCFSSHGALFPTCKSKLVLFCRACTPINRHVVQKLGWGRGSADSIQLSSLSRNPRGQRFTPSPRWQRVLIRLSGSFDKSANSFLNKNSKTKAVWRFEINRFFVCYWEMNTQLLLFMACLVFLSIFIPRRLVSS